LVSFGKLVRALEYNLKIDEVHKPVYLINQLGLWSGCSCFTALLGDGRQIRVSDEILDENLEERSVRDGRAMMTSNMLMGKRWYLYPIGRSGEEVRVFNKLVSERGKRRKLYSSHDLMHGQDAETMRESATQNRDAIRAIAEHPSVVGPRDQGEGDGETTGDDDLRLKRLSATQLRLDIVHVFYYKETPELNEVRSEESLTPRSMGPYPGFCKTKKAVGSIPYDIKDTMDPVDFPEFLHCLGKAPTREEVGEMREALMRTSKAEGEVPTGMITLESLLHLHLSVRMNMTHRDRGGGCLLLGVQLYPPGSSWFFNSKHMTLGILEPYEFQEILVAPTMILDHLLTPTIPKLRQCLDDPGGTDGGRTVRVYGNLAWENAGSQKTAMDEILRYGKRCNTNPDIGALPTDGDSLMSFKARHVTEHSWGQAAVPLEDPVS